MKRFAATVVFVLSSNMLAIDVSAEAILIAPENCNVERCMSENDTVVLNMRALNSVIDRCKRSRRNRIRAKRQGYRSIFVYCLRNAEVALQQRNTYDAFRSLSRCLCSEERCTSLNVYLTYIGGHRQTLGADCSKVRNQ